MEYTTIDNMHISKLTLGTAQLGPSYGIANVTGKPDCKESKEILKVAANHGIHCFDTAPSYGNSESIIGSFLSSYHNFSKVPVIVTKLPPINIDGKVTFSNVYPLVQKHVIESIKQLQIKRIPIYLLHRASDIDACEGLIIESLLELKKEGLIGILGVSTYTPEEVESTLKLDVIKAIQIPVNIFDHRLIKTGLLGQLKDKDFIVFGRSLFLQGLFFLNPQNLPPDLRFAEKPLRHLQELSSEHGRCIAELALTFVRDLPGITSLVIGAETPNQILADINLMESPPLSSELREEIMSIFSDLPLTLINPGVWNLNR